MLSQHYREYILLVKLKRKFDLDYSKLGSTIGLQKCLLRIVRMIYSIVYFCLTVQRFVKYTGYGNAAGLLAQRGLMCGTKSTGADFYSSESEESDTEEYSELRDGSVFFS